MKPICFVPLKIFLCSLFFLPNPDHLKQNNSPFTNGANFQKYYSYNKSHILHYILIKILSLNIIWVVYILIRRNFHKHSLTFSHCTLVLALFNILHQWATHAFLILPYFSLFLYFVFLLQLPSTRTQ